MNRRRALNGLALAGAAGVAAKTLWRPRLQRKSPTVSAVAVVNCPTYELCVSAVTDGLSLVRCDVRGKSVLLKPNLVEYSAAAPINTNPKLVTAVAEVLLQRGAREVLIADGPGHVRDTDLLLDESGFAEQLRLLGRARFLDLNYDRTRECEARARITSLRTMWLPEAVLAADVVISMPKIKTHHWAGVTLSLKNLFGVLPGSVYGWPKNVLHWEGIENSIVELAAAIPIHYVIADGVIAMEGNGPLHGSARPLGCLVVANDPVAADATCCRLMGIDPARVRHLAMAAPLGNLHSSSIEQRGESITALAQSFELLPQFAHLRASHP